jgi:hypothetical protein
MTTDHDIALAFKTAIKPFVLKLYEEAELEIPEVFNADVEAQRVIVSLREQGYSTKFKIAKSKEIM